jgi:hypothetical protein
MLRRAAQQDRKPPQQHDTGSAFSSDSSGASSTMPQMRDSSAWGIRWAIFLRYANVAMALATIDNVNNPGDRASNV